MQLATRWYASQGGSDTRARLNLPAQLGCGLSNGAAPHKPIGNRRHTEFDQLLYYGMSTLKTNHYAQKCPAGATKRRPK